MEQVGDLQKRVRQKAQNTLVTRRNSLREYAEISQFITALSCVGILVIVLLSTRRIHILISERTRLNSELFQSAEEFRNLADSVPQVVWRMTESGALDYVNKGWVKFSGLPPGETPAKFWHALLHPDDRPEFLRQWQDALRRRTAMTAECRLRQSSSGQYRWFLFQGAPNIDPQSGIWKWYATFTDISNLKATERALQRANEELSQFAYVAAHDMQEPLRNIALMLGLFRREYEDRLDEKGTQWVERSAENARRMQAMVKDLLAYSKTLDTREEPDTVSDANECLQHALRNLSAALLEKRADLIVAPLPPVRVQQIHMVQLFQNLIENSLKYRNDQVQPVIRISATQQGHEWVFSVKDNGIGFDPAYAHRIFRVFKRLHNHEQYPGTGMGLAICARVVGHYGGSIWAESKPGEGAAFHFTLPGASRDELSEPSEVPAVPPLYERLVMSQSRANSQG